MSRVPRIRFKGFEEDWEQRKFSELYELVNEKNDGSYGKDSNITVATMQFKSNIQISKNEYLNTYNIFKKGYIAFEGHKSKEFRFGRFVENDIGDGIVSHIFIVFRPIMEFDINFWKYAINNELIMQSILSRATKASTMMNDLVVKDFLKEIFFVPSLGEQACIGRTLKSFDHLITLHQRKLEKLKIIKKSMLENLFPQSEEKTPKIRFSGFTKDWEQRKLGEVADIIGGGTPSTLNSDYWDGNIDWYSPAEIIDQIYMYKSQRKITELGLEKSSAKMLPIGTVLFTSRAGIGKTAILAKRGCTNQGFQSIVPYSNTLDSYFIFSRTEELKKYGELVGAGSTFVEVSGRQMENMQLMIPKTIGEQHIIGLLFSTFDHLITLHQSKLEKLQKIKKSMLESMFV